MGELERHEGGADGLPFSGPVAERVLGTILELTDDAVLTCDGGGVVTFFSENAERLFGRSSPDVVGVHLRRLFAVHLSDEMDRVLATTRAGERTRHFETEVVRSDGLPVPVSLSLAPLADASGVFEATVVVARDVTEQHLAQATLAEVDGRIEESESLAHVGSWLWDRRTGAVQWSAEFYRIHGIDPLDFAGTIDAYLAIIEPADRPVAQAAFSRSVEASLPLDLEYRVRHPDQKVHVILVHAQPSLGSDGKAVGLRGIGRDVSDEAGQAPDGTGHGSA